MLRALLILLLGSTLVAAMLTPVVYQALKLFFSPVPWPYSRVFDRVIMLVAAVILWRERKAFRIADLKPLFAQGSRRARLTMFFAGLLLSLAGVAVMLPSVVQDGKFFWIERPEGYYQSKVPMVIVASIFLSVLEEVFFRAILFTKLSRYMLAPLAALIASLFYAVIHFFSPVKSWTYSDYHILIGFDYLQQLFTRLIMPGIVPGVFGLFLVGMVLCYAFKKTNSIYLCIGLHSGWAMANKLVFHATGVLPGAQFPSGLGRRYFLISQPETWLSILAVFAVLYIWLNIGKRWAMRMRGFMIGRA